MLYTVWVGGTEVNDNYLNNLEDAKLLAEAYRDEGHTDVYIMWKPKEKQDANAQRIYDLNERVS